MTAYGAPQTRGWYEFDGAPNTLIHVTERAGEVVLQGVDFMGKLVRTKIHGRMSELWPDAHPRDFNVTFSHSNVKLR